MVRVELELIGNKLEQFFFYLEYIFARRNTSAVGDAEYMRVYCDRRVPEGDIQDYICSFTSNPRQCFQGLTVVGYR